MAMLLPILFIASFAVVVVQVAAFGHSAHPSPGDSGAPFFGSASNALRSAAATTTGPNWPPKTSTTTAPTWPTRPPTTTTTLPPQPAVQATPAQPPPTTTTTTAPQAPAQTPSAQTATAVPAVGQATQWGCAAALAYLSAYAYPGAVLECPGPAVGKEAMTCYNEPGICSGELLIGIAEACPAAYMNEASNSWVVMGRSTAPIDPYGAC